MNIGAGVASQSNAFAVVDDLLVGGMLLVFVAGAGFTGYIVYSNWDSIKCLWSDNKMKCVGGQVVSVTDSFTSWVADSITGGTTSRDKEDGSGSNGILSIISAPVGIITKVVDNVTGGDAMVASKPATAIGHVAPPDTVIQSTTPTEAEKQIKEALDKLTNVFSFW